MLGMRVRKVVVNEADVETQVLMNDRVELRCTTTS